MTGFPASEQRNKHYTNTQLDSSKVLRTYSNIQERNKPIEPPKKPEKAPFFLPTLPSVSGVPQFVAADKGKTPGEGPSGKKRAPSKVLKHSSDDDYRSEFVRRLHDGAESGDCEWRLLFVSVFVVWLFKTIMAPRRGNYAGFARSASRAEVPVKVSGVEKEEGRKR